MQEAGIGPRILFTSDCFDQKAEAVGFWNLWRQETSMSITKQCACTYKRKTYNSKSIGLSSLIQPSFSRSVLSSKQKGANTLLTFSPDTFQVIPMTAWLGWRGGRGRVAPRPSFAGSHI